MNRWLSLFLLLLFATPLNAQSQLSEERMAKVEKRVERLEDRTAYFGTSGVLAFFFGAFCALWAQNTGRNAWLWFFLGFFLSVIAVLVLLRRNARDIERRGGVLR